MLSSFFDNYWARRNDDFVRIHDLEPVLELLGLSMEALWPRGMIRGKRILEIGPGAGGGSLWMRSGGALVSALDISRVSAGILAGRNSFSNNDGEGSLHPVVGFAEAPPFPDAAFDGIHSQTVWMHLKKDKVAAECRRLLKPGGRLLVVEPMKYNPLVAAFRSFASVGRFSNPEFLSTSDIEKISEGFTKVTVKFKSLLTPPLLVLAAAGYGYGFGNLVRNLVGFEDRLISRVEQLRWYSWFVVMELIK